MISASLGHPSLRTPLHSDYENLKTVSYFQESHSDGADGNDGCDVQWQGHKKVRSEALTERFCEKCSSQYRSRSNQLSPQQHTNVASCYHGPVV